MKYDLDREGRVNARSARRSIELRMPHSDWLDYCDVVFFVSEHATTSNMKGVLRKLERISAATAGAKLQALREVRGAFTYRPGSTAASPSATDFIIAGMCQLAKQHLERTNGVRRMGSNATSRDALWAPATRDFSRCALESM